MRGRWRSVAGAWMAAAVLAAGGARCAEHRGIDALLPLARRAGLRVVESRRLVLVTDRPARDGDGTAELPAIFDQAFDSWCGHFGVPVESIPTWRAFGCLVVDRERFRAAGLLPSSIPDFANGFCAGDTFWLQDQSNPDYRRHLLLHEGVHAFTLTVRNLATPGWYNEGIAEFLATHRLDRTPAGPVFVPTPIPGRPGDVEQLGRIEEIRGLRSAGRMPALADVLGAAPAGHRGIAEYAADWAAVTMLARHPAYAPSFTALQRGPLGPDFTTRLAGMPGYSPDNAARDFDAFTDELDYGYDFSRSSVDWSAGRPPANAVDVRVAAGRGWQNSRVALATGVRYEVRSRGACTLAGDGGGVIETEPDGISLDWYRGRPRGRLLAAQWLVPPAGGRPRFVVLGEGAAAAFAAAVDGPLFLKLNEPPGELGDDAGEFDVTVAPLP